MTELETLSINDVDLACTVLDSLSDARDRATEKAKRKQ